MFVAFDPLFGSKQTVVVVVCACFDMGSLDTNVPFRKRITSRGVALIRRRVDERDATFDDDFNRSQS